MDASDLFDAHLDLSPLRARTHGLVRCIFHPNEGKTPSLSVDLDEGLFHCFACGIGGGVRRFARLVGALPPAPDEALPAPSPRAIRRRAAQRVWFQHGERLEAERIIRNARAAATKAGDGPEAWALLAEAAALERLVWNDES